MVSHYRLRFTNAAAGVACIFCTLSSHRAQADFSFQVRVNKPGVARNRPSSGARSAPSAPRLAPAAPAPVAPAAPAAGFAAAPQAPAATAPSAAAGNGVAQDLSWARLLPTVSQVLSSVHGADANDTRSRQVAAFTTLIEFAEYKTHHNSGRPRASDMPKFIVDRVEEYGNAQNSIIAQAPPQGRSGISGASYHIDKSFRDGLLSAYFAPSLVIAYEAAVWDGPTEQQLANGAQVDARTLRPLEETKKAARVAKTDLSVFGIALGEPLNLPPCGEDNDVGSVLTGLGGLNLGGKETCVGDGNGSLALLSVEFARSLTGMGTGLPTNVRLVNVRLAKSRCPDWVKNSRSCLLIAALQDDYVVGLTFTTGVDQASFDQASRAMREKYRALPKPGRATECRAMLTGNVLSSAHEQLWTVPGLFVTYTPLVGDCRSGRVEVETAFLHENKARAVQERVDNQPKM